MTPDPWTDVAVPLLDAQGGVATSAQLHACGVTPQLLRRWVGSGQLVRLRRNALVRGEVWRAAPPWDRHLVRARAVMLGVRDADPPVALSHHSALAVMGLSVHATDDDVHLVRVGSGTSRRRPGLVRHAAVEEDRITDAFGLPTVTPAVACMQVAATFGAEAGLVAADSALRLGHCAREDLEELCGWPWLGRGRPAAALVAQRADARHESAGETRTSLLLHRLGYDATPQVWIRDASGAAVGRVDLLLAGSRVVVEFDGRLKYSDQGDIVAEKLREDRIRELGYEVVRLTWSDLARPDLVRAKIDAALARDRARQRTG